MRRIEKGIPSFVYQNRVLRQPKYQKKEYLVISFFLFFVMSLFGVFIPMFTLETYAKETENGIAIQKKEEVKGSTKEIRNERKEMLLASESNLLFTLSSVLSLRTKVITDGMYAISDYKDRIPALNTLYGVDVLDLVEYENLEENTEYTLHTALYEIKESGSNILMKQLQSSVLSSDTGSGAWEISLGEDISLDTGKSYIVFEELYDENHELIAQHKEESDASQRLTIKPYSVKVQKVWGEEVTKVPVEVQLQLDGEKIADTVILSEDNAWTHYFSDLDPSLLYEVVELTEGYRTRYTNLDIEWEEASSLNQVEEYILYNTWENNLYYLSPSSNGVDVGLYSNHFEYNFLGDIINVPMKAIWQAIPNGDNTVRLINRETGRKLAYIGGGMQNGSVTSVEVDAVVPNLGDHIQINGDKLQFGNDSGAYHWSGSSSKLSATTSYSNMRALIRAEDSAKIIKIENRALPKKTLDIQKTWDSGTDPIEVEVQVYKDGLPLEDGLIRLNEENHWTYRFHDLPADATYTVEEKTIGNFIPVYDSQADSWENVAAFQDNKEVILYTIRDGEYYAISSAEDGVSVVLDDSTVLSRDALDKVYAPKEESIWEVVYIREAYFYLVNKKTGRKLSSLGNIVTTLERDEDVPNHGDQLGLWNNSRYIRFANGLIYRWDGHQSIGYSNSVDGQATRIYVLERTASSTSETTASYQVLSIQNIAKEHVPVSLPRTGRKSAFYLYTLSIAAIFLSLLFFIFRRKRILK